MRGPVRLWLRETGRALVFSQKQGRSQPAAKAGVPERSAGRRGRGRGGDGVGGRWGGGGAGAGGGAWGGGGGAGGGWCAARAQPDPPRTSLLARHGAPLHRRVSRLARRHSSSSRPWTLGVRACLGPGTPQDVANGRRCLGDIGGEEAGSGQQSRRELTPGVEVGPKRPRGGVGSGRLRWPRQAARTCGQVSPRDGRPS